MTGNIVLDVFIGLAFIYLLYSLYTTIIVEIITSVLRLRSNNLQTAIKRMLTDTEKPNILNLIYPKYWYNYLKMKIKSNENIFTKFYNQPSIKYLAKSSVIGNRKPSYIAPHNFSKAIMDILKSEGTGNTLINRIETGLNNCPIDKNTRYHIESLLEDANNDLTKFKLLLEQWFNDTMERSIGWFKRNNQFILFITGLIIAITFNVNTLHIAKLLSKDNKAREQLVDIAINDKQKYSEAIKYIKEDSSGNDTIVDAILNRIDSLYNMNKNLEEDISSIQVLFGGGWNLPENVKFKKKIVINIDTLGAKKTKSGSCQETTFPNDTVSKKEISKNYKLNFDFFNKSLRIKKHENIDTVVVADIKSDVRYNKCLPNRLSDSKKVIVNTKTYKYVFSPRIYKWQYVKHNFWGYLLTALAISLGASFWFDLLNKLVKLRGSARQGVTSEEPSIKQKTSNESPSDNPLNREG